LRIPEFPIFRYGFQLFLNNLNMFMVDGIRKSDSINKD